MMKYIINEQKLRKQDKESAARLRYIFRRLEPEILDFFNTIPYALINGELLSLAAFGDVGYRPSMDYDFLVPIQHVKDIKKVFFEHGYSEFLYDKEGNIRKPTRKEQIMLINAKRLTAFEKLTQDGVKLSFDINTDILWAEYTGEKIDIEEFISDSIEIELHGVKVRTLTRMKCFIQTCLHHYKLMNSPFYLMDPHKIVLSEGWFQDIYNLYQRGVRNQKSELEHFVNRYKLQDEFFYMLYYTAVVFGDDELYEYAQTFRTDSGVDKLDKFGLCDAERKTWPISFQERMNHPQLFKILKPLLSEKDIEKIIRNSTRTTYRMEIENDFQYDPYYYEKGREKTEKLYE